MIIWIDADACPKGIKEIVIKAGMRLQIEVVLVADQQYESNTCADLIQKQKKETGKQEW